MGIVGMAYVWDGSWIRSPESTEGKERNPIMRLQPVFGPAVDVWGDVGCFTAVERVLSLSDNN